MPTHKSPILRPGPKRQGHIRVVHICEARASHPAFEIRRRKAFHADRTDARNKVPGPSAEGTVVRELAVASVEGHVNVGTFKPATGTQRTSINVRRLYAAGGSR